jgi:peptide deformylase
MAVLPIRKYPDPVLRKKAKRITNIDDSIKKLAQDMLDTLHDAPGVGLAGPQVGVPLRIIVLSIPEDRCKDKEEVWKDMVIINPQILNRKGERVVNEGCLSLPGYNADVKRSESVTVKGRDETGKEIRIKATDLLAQALEHETDHCDGVLYVDYLASLDELKKNPPRTLEEGQEEESEEQAEESKKATRRRATSTKSARRNTVEHKEQPVNQE